MVTAKQVGWACGVALAVLALGVGRPSAAEEGTKIHKYSEKDYAEFKTGDGATELAGYIEGPNMTAGFARFRKGGPALRNWPYWYEEVVYVTRGKGRITIAPPPHDAPKAHEVAPGDLLHIAKGAKVTFEGLSEEPFEFLYVTSPNPGL